MLILPKITVLAPNGFSLKIAPKTTFNTKSFEIRPIGPTCTSIRPVYNGWLVDSETNFLKLPAPTGVTHEELRQDRQDAEEDADRERALVLAEQHL